MKEYVKENLQKKLGAYTKAKKIAKLAITIPRSIIKIVNSYGSKYQQITCTIKLNGTYIVKSFIFYHLNYLALLIPRHEKCTWGPMVKPVCLLEPFQLMGERVIIDLITELSIKGIGIDVGAWVGKYSLLMAKTAKKVISIEPDELNCRFIKKNIALNQVKNVELIQAALSHMDGKAKLVRSFVTAGHSINANGFGYSVKTVSLKTILNQIDEDIDLIKMDIEMAEFPILRNADYYIFSRVKNWIVECHSEKEEERLELENIFKRNGYSIKWIDPEDPIPHIFATKREG